MPQDVTFDLPFHTPVSRQSEYVQERHLYWMRNRSGQPAATAS